MRCPDTTPVTTWQHDVCTHQARSCASWQTRRNSEGGANSKCGRVVGSHHDTTAPPRERPGAVDTGMSRSRQGRYAATPRVSSSLVLTMQAASAAVAQYEVTVHAPPTPTTSRQNREKWPEHQPEASTPPKDKQGNKVYNACAFHAQPKLMQPTTSPWSSPKMKQQWNPLKQPTTLPSLLRM